MDRATARRVAATVGGVATTEARYRGHWASPTEATDPWIVVLPGGVVLRQVPGEDA